MAGGRGAEKFRFPHGLIYGRFDVEEADGALPPAPFGETSEPEIDFDAQPSQSEKQTYDQHHEDHRNNPPFYSGGFADPAHEAGFCIIRSPEAPANFASANPRVEETE